jgi:hypothetical protein
MRKLYLDILDLFTDGLVVFGKVKIFDFFKIISLLYWLTDINFLLYII